VSNNIFAHIFSARALTFHEDAEARLRACREQVLREVRGEKPCDTLRFVMFKVTNKCNGGCIYCGYSRQNRQVIAEAEKTISNTDKITDLLDSAAEMGALAIAYNGGEPLLRDDIDELITAAVQRGILPILMTNGLLLPAKWRTLGAAGLKYIMISLDSLDPDTCMYQRGVALETILEGVNAALRMREIHGDMMIHLTAVVTKHNARDIRRLAEFATENHIWLELYAYHHTNEGKDVLSIEDEAMCDELIKTIREMKAAHYMIATSDEYIYHLRDFFIHKQRMPENYRCMTGFTTLQVDSSLDVRPCWGSSFGVLGNAGKQSLKELWTCGRMEQYRKKMLAGRCGSCWNMCNEINALLNERVV